MPDLDSGSRDLHAETEKLLKLAEELQRNVDVQERRATYQSVLLTSVLSVILTATGVLLLTLWPDTQLTSMTRSLTVAAAVLSVVGYFFNFALIVLPIKRIARRDTRALYAVVDTLREVEQMILQKGAFSPLERAEFRIRLSRFNIGERNPSQRSYLSFLADMLSIFSFPSVSVSINDSRTENRKIKRRATKG